jgi:Sec-independent protein translocase protein TatA
MEILGIGPLELTLILILALILFGPKDIDKAGKIIGRNLNKLIRSDTWKTINQTSQELKNLPTRLMRETGLDELEKSTKEDIAQVDKAIHQSLESISVGDATPPAAISKPDNSVNADPISETTEKSPTE